MRLLDNVDGFENTRHARPRARLGFVDPSATTPVLPALPSDRCLQLDLSGLLAKRAARNGLKHGLNLPANPALPCECWLGDQRWSAHNGCWDERTQTLISLVRADARRELASWAAGVIGASLLLLWVLLFARNVARGMGWLA